MRVNQVKGNLNGDSTFRIERKVGTKGERNNRRHKKYFEFKLQIIDPTSNYFVGYQLQMANHGQDRIACLLNSQMQMILETDIEDKGALCNWDILLDDLSKIVCRFSLSWWCCVVFFTPN